MCREGVAAWSVKTICEHVTRESKCWSQRGVILSAEWCVFVEQFWPQDGCRLLSEPTVLECTRVELCCAMNSRMRLHKFLYRRQLGCCLSFDFNWELTYPAADEWPAALLLCPLAASCVPWRWHEHTERDSRKVTAAACFYLFRDWCVIERMTFEVLLVPLRFKYLSILNTMNVHMRSLRYICDTVWVELLCPARPVCALCATVGTVYMWLCMSWCVLHEYRYALLTAQAIHWLKVGLRCRLGYVCDASLQPGTSVFSCQLPQLPTDRPTLRHACAATAL